MKTLKLLIPVLFAAVLTQNFAMAQKKEFKAAIKNEVYSFDGYYYVDLSKAAVSETDFLSFAEKNGYVIKSYKKDKIVQFGESMIGVTSAIMIPVGEQPNPEKGHLNPADEPYKTISRIVKETIRKGVNENGQYVYNATDSGISMDYKDAITAIINQNNCIWTAYKTDVGWGKFAHNYIELYFVNQNKMSEAILASSFSDVSISKVNIKTGKARLDPDKSEWVEGIVWTGQVVDGKISGKGYGAKLIDQNESQGLVIDGTFKDGLPAGNVIYRYGKYGPKSDLSLYGLYNIHDYDHLGGGISLSLTPTGNAGVMMIERSRVTKDLYQKVGVHNTRKGYVDSQFNTLSWLPLNTNIVQTQNDGKTVIKHRINGSDNARGIFYSVSEEVEYVVSTDGKYSLSDTELKSLLNKYDRAMGNWDEMLKPYNQNLTPYAMPNLWDAYSQWDHWLNQIDNSLLSQQPLDYVKSKRSNYNQFEILRKLSRINELTFPKKWPSEYFILKNPSYAVNCKREVEGLMSKLRSDKEFNPPYMEKVFDKYLEGLDRNIEYYKGLYAKAVRNEEDREIRNKISMAEVDVERSTDPSGKKSSLGFLSSYYELEKDGVVKLKNGDYLEYNTVYDSSDKLQYYVVKYSYPEIRPYQREYKSYNEMVRALSNASLNK